MSWVAIEDASSAFERPAWAVEKMVAEGKLERRVEADGRVFVRCPPTLDELAAELAAFLPDEVIPVVATILEEEDDARPAPSKRAEAGAPGREELMLRALWELVAKQQMQIDEIRRLAERPLALPAPPPAPAVTPAAPPRRRRARLTSVALGLLIATAGLGYGIVVQDASAGDRERSDRALDHAEWLTRRLLDERREAAPIPSGAAWTSSGSSTLPAGFRR